jgi:PadR family transcriptional regulator, regulatory protein PadR
MAMSEQAFFVLTALAGKPQHGYGIMQDADELSGGRMRLKVGSLYGVLDRLVSEGLVALDREEAHQGRLRRYFRLTDDGRAALAREVERQAANVAAARVRLQVRPTGEMA